jgi:hypothetical protein
MRRVSFVCSAADGVDADALPLAGSLFEPYLSVDKCKQRVVAAYSDVPSSLDDAGSRLYTFSRGQNSTKSKKQKTKPFAKRAVRRDGKIQKMAVSELRYNNPSP